VHIHVEMEGNLIISEARRIAIEAERLVESIADIQCAPPTDTSLISIGPTQ